MPKWAHRRHFYRWWDVGECHYANPAGRTLSLHNHIKGIEVEGSYWKSLKISICSQLGRTISSFYFCISFQHAVIWQQISNVYEWCMWTFYPLWDLLWDLIQWSLSENCVFSVIETCCTVERTINKNTFMNGVIHNFIYYKYNIGFRTSTQTQDVDSIIHFTIKVPFFVYDTYLLVVFIRHYYLEQIPYGAPNAMTYNTNLNDTHCTVRYMNSNSYFK